MVLRVRSSAQTVLASLSIRVLFPIGSSLSGDALSRVSYVLLVHRSAPTLARLKKDPSLPSYRSSISGVVCRVSSGRSGVKCDA